MKAFRFRIFILMASISTAGVIIYSAWGVRQWTWIGLTIILCFVGAWLLTGWFARWYLSPLLRLFQFPPDDEEKTGSLAVDDPEIQKIPELLLLKDRFDYLASLSKKQTLDLQENVTQTEVALRTKADFVRNMSHILRTPIGTILGLSEALQEKGFPKEHQRELHTIYYTAYDLSQMIVNLLILAEMDYGMIQFDKQWIVLKEFVDQITTDFLTTMKHDLNEQPLEWGSSVPDRVFFDPHYLKQMLIALMQTAFKMRQEPSLRFSIYSDNEKTISFSIHLPKLLLTADELTHVFERFPPIVGKEDHRYHSSRAGLALIRELAKLQGGSSQITSKAEEGTHLGFTLPLDYDVDSEINVSSDSSTDDEEINVSEKETYTSEKSETNQADTSVLPDILIVEDDPGYQMALQASIPASQYTTRIARDGREALEQVRMALPDLVLMDLMMPDMDGYEAMRQLQKDPVTEKIPVVALTALATGEDHERVMRSGFKTHLSKPVTPKELRRVLERLLGTTDTSQ